jgi:hypothetical protein
MLRTVLGLVEPDFDVRPLLEDLRHAGYRPEEIGLMMPLRGEAPTLQPWLVAARPTPIPDLGTALVAGPVAPALTGTCAGLKDLRAALLGLAVDPELAALVAGQVRDGKTLVMVRSESAIDAARRLLVSGEPVPPAPMPEPVRERRPARGRGRHIRTVQPQGQ